jgi:hypothetical protein
MGKRGLGRNAETRKQNKRRGWGQVLGRERGQWKGGDERGSGGGGERWSRSERKSEMKGGRKRCVHRDNIKSWVYLAAHNHLIAFSLVEMTSGRT